MGHHARTDYDDTGTHGEASSRSSGVPSGWNGCGDDAHVRAVAGTYFIAEPNRLVRKSGILLLPPG